MPLLDHILAVNLPALQRLSPVGERHSPGILALLDRTELLDGPSAAVLSDPAQGLPCVALGSARHMGAGASDWAIP